MSQVFWPEKRPAKPVKQIRGWFTPENHAFLEAAIQDAQNIVEIGSWMGRSTRFIVERNPCARVFCLDTWQGGQEHQDDPELEDIHQAFMWNLWDHRHQVLMVKGRSQEALEDLRAVPVDVVYIDGSHETQDVFWDTLLSIRNWPEAAILGDDWQMASVRAGVQKALAAYPDLTAIHDRNAWRIVKRSEHGPGFLLYWKVRPLVKKALAIPARYYSGLA